MMLLSAFLRLVRWQNLLFIALTQVLFYYCFMYSRERELLAFQENLLKPSLFVLLVVSSVLIAAAGYIINDYFDLNIDKINKPTRIIVEKIIRRRWAIVWHLMLTTLGVVLSFYVGYKINNIFLGLLNLCSAVLLLFYSTKYKKELMIGNIIISLLTAWVVIVLYFCELRFYYVFNLESERYKKYITQLFKAAVLYGGFAFIISMIREVVKDLEDMQGDEKFGCRTMPIIWGIPASKIFVGTWLVVLIGALVIVQFYALQLHWWFSALYCVAFIIVPLIYILRKLGKAMVQHDYHKLSTQIKLVMLTGILSMIFFKIYG
ncbi:MAG: geranylgeranylglycerol-phosphate geranylgeranyltransferase [Chitinophagaceae bacterium]